MAAEELSGLSGSNSKTLLLVFSAIIRMIALAFNETFTGSRTKQRQSSNNNPKDEGKCLQTAALLLATAVATWSTYKGLFASIVLFIHE